MGGRGGSSHRGAGGGRSGRDQLAPWRDNQTALQQIMRDTGFTLAEAQLAQTMQIRYYGADYETFTRGGLPTETETISEALMRMPYYSGGAIWRGITLDDADADKAFIGKWKPGTVQHFTDKQGNGAAVIQSFSSSERVAESFGNWSSVRAGSTSIKFIVEGNKTAPGVQHISKFGVMESEVLMPSYQNLFVDRVVQVAPTRNGGRRFEIYLKDRGRKK